jgi:hypothetical protein
VATNIGTTPLLAVTITDPSIVSLTCLPIANGRALAPQQQTVCTGRAVVSQSQINAGVNIINNAAASGIDATGVAVNATASASVTVAQIRSIAVTKSCAMDSFSVVGQPLRYTVTIRNTGTVVVPAYTVVDPLVTLVCTPSSIAPNQLATCNGTYIVTPSDIASGGPIINTASVSVPALGIANVVGSVSTPLSNQGQVIGSILFRFVSFV